MSTNSLKIKILISDRNYTDWSFQDLDTNAEIPKDSILFSDIVVDPVQAHLFSTDVFEIANSKIQIVHSPVRTKSAVYAGVLQLDSGKTYGRTANKKRLLYKCMPDDIRLPAFLIPYELKLGFEKKIKNKYVVFRYEEWRDKHPQGLLVETLGDVDSLDVFYEYQLYCKSLHIPINEITSQARFALNKKTHQEYINQIVANPDFSIQDRRKDYIFTIDPRGSLDFDDGFSISRMPDGRRKISVYIANVAVWLETLGLWKSFSQRVATIYLPDRRRPMLPSILSEALCSLQEGQPRFAFVMDVIIEEDGSICRDSLDANKINFSNALIQVSKNYRYEEDQLYADSCYRDLFEITNRRDSFVTNSHDVVSYWMVQMNKICASLLADKKRGIFRSVTFLGKEENIHVDQSVDPECRRVIQNWNNTIGQYLLYTEDSSKFQHKLMDLEKYIHITSPIRRLVDLLNQMLFGSLFMDTHFSVDATAFMENWLNRMDYINASMRSIRKIQNECDLLYKCSENPELLEGIYRGYIFDKLTKNDGSISFMVYLEEWKMLSRVTLNSDTVKNYSYCKFKLFLFEDEDKTKKKIRLQLISL